MQIKASCKYDLNAMKALIYLTMFKKANPKKCLIFLIGLFVLSCSMLIADAVVLGFEPRLLVMLATNIFAIALLCFWFFAVPKIRHKALAKMQDIENEYIFCDDKLKAFTKSKEYSGEAEIEYSVFVKAYETSKYIFLYQTKNQAYLVDKSTITDGTADEIRNKLTEIIKDKYILCKY